jgi:hypothetical protein
VAAPVVVVVVVVPEAAGVAVAAWVPVPALAAVMNCREGDRNFPSR